MRLLGRFNRLLIAGALGLLLVPEIAGAQSYFQYSGYGDLLLGFRKTGAHQGTYELVVNAGNVTNFLALAPGTQITISNFSPAQLTDSFADGYGNLQWSAFSTFQLSSPWVTPVGTFPKTTLWLTVASPATNMQSAPFARAPYTAQGSVRQNILSVGSGAKNISSMLGTINTDNNSVLVREPLTSQYSSYNLTVFIGDMSDSTIGDFNSPIAVVENTTPNTFTSAQRSDFYQSVPFGFTDPTTGTTNGNAYFVGYFLLNPGGTMTFTRATVTVPTPPPPVLTIQRSGSTSTVSFGTTNGPTYTLYFTNSAGLTAPVHTWPSSPTTVTGDGGSHSIPDTTTDAVRFYRVEVH
jgi:hypothetical protein